jgi:rhodanese-related sulfurtransferase
LPLQTKHTTQHQNHKTTVSAAAGGGTGSIRQMTPQELHALLEDDAAASAYQWVDVRERAEHALASLPRFELYPLSEAATWADTITDALDVDKPTVVLCHHGVRSMQMAAFLASRGYSDVANVTGGIHAYSCVVDPNVPTY